MATNHKMRIRILQGIPKIKNPSLVKMVNTPALRADALAAYRFESGGKDHMPRWQKWNNCTCLENKQP